MPRHSLVLDAVEQVLSWNLPDAAVGRALAMHVQEMTGVGGRSAGEPL